MSYILLHNNRRVDPFEIESYDFSAEDFIHPLALLNRYTGHTQEPYSVAQHTVHLSLCKQVKERGLSRAAVLHDFNEALTNDLPHPHKSQLPEFRKFEERVQRHLFNVFGEPWENMEALTEFDRRICEDEMNQLFVEPHSIGMDPLGLRIRPLHWEVAEHLLRTRCDEVGVK